MRRSNLGMFRWVHQAIGLRDAPDAPDGELLARFVNHQDESAFALLLRRHSPMVLGVCRRMLNDPHDVEDAFQATFYIFVRKAASIAHGKAVGSWLYRVAYHTAARVRSGRNRLRITESPVEAVAVDLPSAAEPAEELQHVLDDAINALPARYRLPIVACYLEGRKPEEVARDLGCRVGTLWTRLSRAREHLRGVLSSRGITMSAVALATVLEKNVSAAVPNELMNSTFRAGLLLASGQTVAAGAFPPCVESLAKEVVRGFLVSQLRTATLVLAAMVTLIASSWLAFCTGAENPGLPAAPVSGEASVPLLQPNEVADLVKWQKLIPPQPGESRWRELPWLTSLSQARVQAAAEGKPIYLHVTTGGCFLGPCSGWGHCARVPRFWTEDRLQVIRQHFVAVAVDRDAVEHHPGESQFLRDSCGFSLTKGHEVGCLTAGGRWLDQDPIKGWGEFCQLTKEERLPGVVTVDEPNDVAATLAAPAPPPGGLVLKIDARLLTRDGSGQLRHALPEDFRKVADNHPDRLSYFMQASPDHMWLTEREWRSLISPAPRQGDRQRVPEAVVRRMLRYHLSPHHIYAQGGTWPKQSIRRGEMELTVTAVSPSEVRMCLDGLIALGAAEDQTLTFDRQELGYEARCHGQLSYDRQQQRFKKVSLTVLGDVYGKMPDGKGHVDGMTRQGHQPLGFTFELVAGDAPADRIPPTGQKSGMVGYFGPD
jgi:RNA polymerase sigma factor (sigma-70 family)